MIRFYLVSDTDLTKYGFKDYDRYWGIKRNGWCRIKIFKSDNHLTLDAPTNTDLLVLMKLYSDKVIKAVNIK